MESLDCPSNDSGRWDRRAAMDRARTLVIKVGTQVLSRESGEMALGRIHSVIEEIVDLRRGGRNVILVSSGAISMGRHALALADRPRYLADKQACAAVGQIRLMAVYQQAFRTFGLTPAQILLTESDFANRGRYLNLRNTMGRLLELGALPIVNENDSISTSEIEELPGRRAERSAVFGDNDVLSALVTSKLGADLLVLLSDIDGLYAQGRPPSGGAPGASGGAAGARPLSVVREVGPEIEAMAAGAGNGPGRGGMATKLRAARIAVRSGAMAVIANGRRAGILQAVLAGEDVGTLFTPRRALQSRKRWILFASTTRGRVRINEGARKALVAGRSSLLFAGIEALEDDFHRGDVVSVVDHAGREIARGISNFDRDVALPLLGLRSEEIAAREGRNHEEFIHRDNLALHER